MRMFVLLSRFQKPLEEVNRFLTTHSVWVQQHYEFWALPRLRTA